MPISSAVNTIRRLAAALIVAIVLAGALIVAVVALAVANNVATCTRNTAQARALITTTAAAAQLTYTQAELDYRDGKISDRQIEQATRAYRDSQAVATAEREQHPYTVC